MADTIGETKTLEVLLGLNVNKNFRIMGSYINFLGHSDSSTHYGGVCVLF